MTYQNKTLCSRLITLIYLVFSDGKVLHIIYCQSKQNSSVGKAPKVYGSCVCVCVCVCVHDSVVLIL